MRPSGKEGFGYLVKFEAEITGDGTTALAQDGFYWITKKAETASAFPASSPEGEDVGVDDFVYLKSGTVLAAGDAVKPMTLEFLGFCRDIDTTSQKQKFDDTTQADVRAGIKSYTESALSEVTGSISGYYETDSQAQELVERRFRAIIKDEGGTVTRLPTIGGVFHFMLSLRETSTVGELEVWEYKPMIIDQLTQKKPLEGLQEFNFNYTIDGKHHPAVYKRRI